MVEKDYLDYIDSFCYNNVRYSEIVYNKYKKGGKDMKKELTNLKFSKSDVVFQKACELAGIHPTLRQASKWRNKKGLSYRFKNKANRIIHR